MTPAPLRQFRQHSLYALACATTLALAVAAAATSFAVVKRALFDPLPYADGERLVSVQTSADNRTGSVSVFVFDDLRHASGSPLTGFAALRFSASTYQAAESAETLDAQEVMTTFFDTLGVQPVMGTSLPDGDPNAAVVSWRFWQRQLAAAPDAIGRSIVVDGVPRHVVGVMSERFMAPYSPQVDLFLPLDLRPLLADTARARRTITVLARRAPGITQDHIDAYMRTFSQGQRDRYPTIHGREHWVAQPLRVVLMGNARPAIFGTAAAAGLLVLIVCANIAGLSAVNAAAQRQQYAIRAALGASGGRILRERLVDSLVLSTLGTVIGLCLAYPLITAVARYQRHFLGMMAPVTFDASIALAALAVGAVTGVAAALAPHSAIARLRIEDPLRAARGTTTDKRLAVVRSALVVVQVAVAIVLMVGAGLLVRTITHLSATAIGYETERLGYFQVTLPLPRYRATDSQVAFERDVLARLDAVPGVRGASASVGFPVMGSMGARLTIMGRPDQAAPPEIVYYSVSPGFFSFLDVPMLEGRDIAESDNFPAPRVVVINETMARLFWPEGGAIGSSVKIGAGAATDREILIVGVAADVRQHGPTQDVRPTAYGSTLQYSWPRRYFAARTDRPIASLNNEVRAAISAVDPTVAATTIRPIDEVVEEQTARHRLVTLALSVFGGVAVVLCAFGLYATVALSSQVRRREYAIRVALGSSRRHVCWLVLRQSILLAIVGGVAGVALASAGTQTLAGLLHGVSAGDRATLVAAFLAMLAIASISASRPALQAGRVDPVEALKTE